MPPLRFLIADAPDLDEGLVLEVWRGEALLADLRPEPDGWVVTFFAAGPLRLTVVELAELNRRVSQFVAEEPHPTASA